MRGGCSSPGSRDPQPRVDCKRYEVTHALERWSSTQGNLRAQNAAYRLAWGKNGEKILEVCIHLGNDRRRANEVDCIKKWLCKG